MKKANEIIKNFATPSVVVKREFLVGKRKGMLMYNPDLTNAELIAHMLRVLEENKSKVKNLSHLNDKFVIVGETSISNDLSTVVQSLLSGDCIVFLDKTDGYVIVNARQYEVRAVSEPPTSNVMQGAREGFVEDVKTNLSLLERRLRSPALAIEKLRVGRISSTTVAIVYLGNVVDKRVVDRVRQRLNAIDVDGAVDTNFIRAFIEDKPTSLFAQSSLSEKPDVVSSKLLEGRVAIIVDGSPMVLTVPFMLVEDFQSGDDYYQRSAFATFLRIIRSIGVITAVFLPGLYVALQIFHYNIIPMRFILTLMSSVNGIPFKPLSETMFVLFLFEIIREAGIRTPRAVGMAMSIVGALVLGDTAVKAGIISSPAVMIVALSSIALYTVPNQVGTMSILRILFTLLGGVGGLYLLMCAGLYTVAYLTSHDSYETPYLAPLSPLVKEDLKDSFVKVSAVKMKYRPKALPGKNKRRQK